MNLPLHPIPAPDSSVSTSEIVRARIYCRVSFDKQNGRSVDEQEQLARKLAERNGWPIAEVYVDNSLSASRFAKKERKQYAKMIRDLQPNEVIIIFADNRGNRNVDEFVELRRLCAELPAFFAYGGRIYDMRVGKDRVQALNDAARAEAYSEDLSAAIRRATYANAELGKPHGPPPFGYARVPADPVTGLRNPVVRDGRELYWLIVPEEARAIRTARDMILSGSTMHGVMKRFRQEGVKTHRGAYFGMKSLKRLLTSPAIAGYRTVDRKPVSQGAWEPIISAEDHEKLVEIINRRAASMGYSRGPGRTAKYLMSGILLCHCGGTMYRKVRSDSTAGAWDIYMCVALRGGGDASGHVSRSKSLVDSCVEETVLAALSSEELCARVEEGLRAAGGVGDVERRALLDEAKRLEDHLEEYWGLAADPANGIPPAFMAKMSRETTEKIEALYQRAAPDVSDAMPLFRAVRDADPEAYWERASVEDKRSIVSAMFVVTALPYPKGAIPPYGERADYIDFQWRV